MLKKSFKMMNTFSSLLMTSDLKLPSGKKIFNYFDQKKPL